MAVDIGNSSSSGGGVMKSHDALIIHRRRNKIDLAPMVSIFLTLTGFHSMPAAPTIDLTATATET